MSKSIMKSLFATIFGIGYSKFAPGTCGSLAGAAIYLLLYRVPLLYFFITLFIIAAGFYVCRDIEVIFKKKDPQEVVIDEAAGMMVAFLFIPFSIKWAILGFLIFRVFDIAKPYPIRRLEKLKGAKGIMADDLAAGIYTNLLIRALMVFWG